MKIPYFWGSSHGWYSFIVYFWCYFDWVWGFHIECSVCLYSWRRCSYRNILRLTHLSEGWSLGKLEVWPVQKLKIKLIRPISMNNPLFPWIFCFRCFVVKPSQQNVLRNLSLEEKHWYFGQCNAPPYALSNGLQVTLCRYTNAQPKYDLSMTWFARLAHEYKFGYHQFRSCIYWIYDTFL